MQKPQTVLNPSEFTQLVFNKLKDIGTFKRITKVEDLYIIGEYDDAYQIDMRLNNVYTSYKSDPDNLDHFLKRLLSSINEGMQKQNEINFKKVIPLIRSTNYLADSADIAHVKLNSELIIVYAEDLPNGFNILSQKDLVKFKLDSQSLLNESINNLANVINELEVQILSNGCYMVTAGGDCESSLILDEIIWRNSQFPIQGDPVFAVPAKDMFLFTGKKNIQGIKKLQEVIDQVFNDGDHLISRHLFTLHESNLVIFKP